MKAEQVFEAEPGSVTLLYCEEDRLEAMVSALQSSVPDRIRERAALNAARLVSMEMSHEDKPSDFHDLAALCARLITAAGRRSRFEGVLMLDVSDLLRRPEDFDRLRALGEVLAMDDGPASACTTLIYGPTDERQVLIAAEALDFASRLRVEPFEGADRRDSLDELLRDASMRSDSEASKELLRGALDEMRGDSEFDPLRFLKSCGGKDGVITEDSVCAALNNPYSYVNRLKKARALFEQRRRMMADRRIGFRSDH